jgi:hypothetical protein
MGFDEEESAALRREFLRQSIRVAVVFAALCAGVAFVFWWSGSAVRFGAASAAGRVVPSWHVIGTVRDAATGDPIPWAAIDDVAYGDPALSFRIDADRTGAFDLLTLTTPHLVRIQASGYRPITVSVGSRWYVWMPSGEERRDVTLRSD